MRKITIRYPQKDPNADPLEYYINNTQTALDLKGMICVDISIEPSNQLLSYMGLNGSFVFSNFKLARIR